MEVDSEQVGQKLVKMLRRQYINNRGYNVEQKKELLSQVAQSEIKELEIEF